MEIRTTKGTYTRPVQRLHKLEMTSGADVSENESTILPIDDEETIDVSENEATSSPIENDEPMDEKSFYQTRYGRMVREPDRWAPS